VALHWFLRGNSEIFDIKCPAGLSQKVNQANAGCVRAQKIVAVHEQFADAGHDGIFKR
jgi:hypothetical protein